MKGNGLFGCPCCGYLTLQEQPPGTFELCPICYWEDDNVQYEDPDFRGGANVVSLREAQQNFLYLGASQEQFRKHVRSPTEQDGRDPNWRPLGSSN